MTREQGKSVLVTTHDMNVAQELCDRIGIINHGKLITCRPTGELLRHFSDFAVEFKLDRQPDAAALWDVPGVKAVEAGVNGDGQICTMRFEGSAEQRSEAIYEALARMRAQGLVLLGVSQRQERLEDVFVRLTSEASARPESAPAGR
jgi:ABC-2 type transport system ATP-binding protein